MSIDEVLRKFEERLSKLNKKLTRTQWLKNLLEAERDKILQKLKEGYSKKQIYQVICELMEEEGFSPVSYPLFLKILNSVLDNDTIHTTETSKPKKKSKGEINRPKKLNPDELF
jgi:hypothetical protein